MVDKHGVKGIPLRRMGELVTHSICGPSVLPGDMTPVDTLRSVESLLQTKPLHSST